MDSVTSGGRVVIFTGGGLGDWALRLPLPGDYLIGADRGAFFLLQAGFTPDLAVGDFDTVTPEQLEAIRRGSRDFRGFDPVDKDYTDTELAFRLAMERSPAQIVIAGGLGSRFDHSLANVHLLMTAHEAKIDTVVMDGNNAVRLIGPRGALCIRQESYDQVSLLPLSPVVTGITLTGFQYPLTNAQLRMGQSLGISNQISDLTGTISISEGYLLVIQSRG